MSHRCHAALKRTSLLLACLVLSAFPLLGSSANAPTSPQDHSTQTPRMNLFQASILGVVEGLTEYLPISSTGHLLLTQKALGMGTDATEKEASDAYAVCIQAGAILAVLFLYFGRIRQMARGVLGADADGKRLLTNAILAFLPALAAGLLLEKPIKRYLFGTELGLWPVVSAWFAGGLAILVVCYALKKRKDPRAAMNLEGLTWRAALAIGGFQCIAMWPGMSRSLLTIVGGLLMGLSLSAAVEFSFILGLVTLSAATAHDALSHGKLILSTFGIAAPALGLVVAFISAFLSVKWMVSYLQKRDFTIFGYYRVALAIFVAALIFGGKL